MNLPDRYKEAMLELLGEQEYEKYIQSFSMPRYYGLRVNTNKISVEDFLKLCPFKLTPVPWISNGFYYEEDEKPAKHPYYFAGLYYLQEPSAMTPAYVLPINEGDRVLDLCAAPGGKSTELGAKLRGTGLLVSNDISASRAKALIKNIEVFGVGNSIITCEYPEKLVPRFEEYFDKILVDAPCSGEGMFRKDFKLIKAWESNGPEYFAPLQSSILSNAAKMLKPGGYLLYSTCTFSRMEDEDNIEQFLAENPDFSLEKIYEYDGFVRAFGMEEAIRLFPHHLEGEGHFVALLHKAGVLSENLAGNNAKAQKLPQELIDFIDEFTMDFELDKFRIVGENVYYLPYGDVKLNGLRVMKNGVYFGEIKKNRFEPGQSLAMWIKASDFKTTVNLSVADPNVIKYLKGETIELESDNICGNGKNALVCVDGFPLGWGKLNDLTLKNKYLPGWRWM